MSEDTLAIDIGGTKIAAGLVRDGCGVAAACFGEWLERDVTH